MARWRPTPLGPCGTEEPLHLSAVREPVLDVVDGAALTLAEADAAGTRLMVRSGIEPWRARLSELGPSERAWRPPGSSPCIPSPPSPHQPLSLLSPLVIDRRLWGPRFTPSGPAVRRHQAKTSGEEADHNPPHHNRRRARDAMTMAVANTTRETADAAHMAVHPVAVPAPPTPPSIGVPRAPRAPCAWPNTGRPRPGAGLVAHRQSLRQMPGVVVLRRLAGITPPS